MNTIVAHSSHSNTLRAISAGAKTALIDALSLLKLTTIISAFLAIQAYCIVL